jgi:hypothetical protein
MSLKLQRILEMTIERLSQMLDLYLPPTLALIVIVLTFYVAASLARWLLLRIFKGAAMDRFLRQSGVASIFRHSRPFHASRMVARAVFWIILGAGFLTGLNAFNTELASRLVETVVLLAPKLVAAGFILLAGLWLGQYLGRSTLVWAVNEELPSARLIAAAVRILIVFASVVVAADHLNFAKNVFLTAFVLLVGGAVLATSLSVALASRGTAQRWLNAEKRTPEEESFWKHL